MNKVIELFGYATKNNRVKWGRIIRKQQCPFLGKTCYKVRKSNPDVAIGTCAVLYGKASEPIVICPARLLDKRKIFIDCLHLLTAHEPGNELHIVPEVSVPGGSVDFFLVSVRKGTVRDFVGIELQTLDTTGTVWPERQRFLRERGIERDDHSEDSNKSFGMNWKMTAKTILVQMHHKIHTFEHVNRKLVLIVQDKLLEYMAREFNFTHLENPARTSDSMHFHAYSMSETKTSIHALALDSRWSTDASGIGMCLDLQAEAKVELERIVQALQAKISSKTLFSPV
ncbi:MAG: hypothetical protein L3K26_02050 [Candidatus Hydrogenedentes bacterium]|nr:hypothetical protein [Candidatus Hydrogenedentota bacterium]